MKRLLFLVVCLAAFSFSALAQEEVKVLKMKDAKDPDEFLHKFGADKFKLLLEGSSNRVEYQLNAIAAKYDLSQDDQKVRFLHDCADLISTLGSPVQREIYAGRVAEAAKISMEAMKMEIGRAWKRRQYQQKKLRSYCQPH